MISDKEALDIAELRIELETFAIDHITPEVLEEKLLAYPGTLLLVSHDREFLDHVVTSSIVLLGVGTVQFCPGGYVDWQRIVPGRDVCRGSRRGEFHCNNWNSVPIQRQ